jgi:hypothetical protein
MQFLSIMVAVGYVLVGRVVRPGHAGTLNNFFGTSITVSATQLLCAGQKQLSPGGKRLSRTQVFIRRADTVRETFFGFSNPR